MSRQKSHNAGASKREAHGANWLLRAAGHKKTPLKLRLERNCGLNLILSQRSSKEELGRAIYTQVWLGTV